MIKRYKDFIKFAINESLESLNESMLYFSNEFRDRIANIDDPIATKIANMEMSDIKPDMTFVDIGEEGFVTFTTMNNIKKSLAEKEIEVVESPVDNKENRIKWVNDIFNRQESQKSRNPVKLGRFINRLMPGEHTDSEIEKFVNIFKSSDTEKDVFKIVEGIDIAYWYSGTNYTKGEGTLNKSCMSTNNSSNFDIYVDNPEVCRMLILLDMSTNGSKILGRALIWKISSDVDELDGKYFMDRQYTVKDSDVFKFINYAERNGWAYKNSAYSVDVVLDGEEYKYPEMSVSINDNDYDSYPYVDTFRLFIKDDSILSNSEIEQIGSIVLDNTGGSYTDPSRVYSDYIGDYINEDVAVYSEIAESYLDRNDSIFVDVLHAWYPKDHRDIVTKVDGRLAHYEECVYSEYEDEYYDIDDAVEAIIEVSDDGEVDSTDYFLKTNENIVEKSEFKNTIWFKRLKDNNSNWKYYRYIHDDALYKVDGVYYLSKYSIRVYKVIGENFSLSKIDSYILNYKIEKDFTTIDNFVYNSEIEDRLPEIYSKGSDKLKEEPESDIEIAWQDLVRYRLEELDEGLIIDFIHD